MARDLPLPGHEEVSEMEFEGAIELLGLAIDVVAVVVIFVAAIAAGVVFARGLPGTWVPEASTP